MLWNEEWQYTPHLRNMTTVGHVTPRHSCLWIRKADIDRFTAVVSNIMRIENSPHISIEFTNVLTIWWHHLYIFFIHRNINYWQSSLIAPRTNDPILPISIIWNKLITWADGLDRKHVVLWFALKGELLFQKHNLSSIFIFSLHLVRFSSRRVWDEMLLGWRLVNLLSFSSHKNVHICFRW